jgi:hypothetical protein
MLTLAELARVREEDLDTLVAATAENARTAFSGIR